MGRTGTRRYGHGIGAAGRAFLLLLLVAWPAHAERFRFFSPTRHRNGDRVAGRRDAAHLDLGLVDTEAIDATLAPFTSLHAKFDSEHPPTIMIWFSPDRTVEEQKRAKANAVRTMEDWTERHYGVRITPRIEWGFLDKTALDPKAGAREIEGAVEGALTAIEAERLYGMKKGLWQKLGHPSYNRDLKEINTWGTTGLTALMRLGSVLSGGIGNVGPYGAAVEVVDPAITYLYNRYVEEVNRAFDEAPLPIFGRMMGKDSPLLKRYFPRANDWYKRVTGRINEIYEGRSARAYEQRTPSERQDAKLRDSLEARDEKIKWAKNFFTNFVVVGLAHAAVTTEALHRNNPKLEPLSWPLVGGWAAIGGADTVFWTMMMNTLEHRRQQGAMSGSTKRALIYLYSVYGQIASLMSSSGVPYPNAFFLGILATTQWPPILRHTYLARTRPARTDKFLLFDERIAGNLTDIHDTEAATEHPITAHGRSTDEVIAEVSRLGIVGKGCNALRALGESP